MGPDPNHKFVLLLHVILAKKAFYQPVQFQLRLLVLSRKSNFDVMLMAHTKQCEFNHVPIKHCNGLKY